MLKDQNKNFSFIMLFILISCYVTVPSPRRPPIPTEVNIYMQSACPHTIDFIIGPVKKFLSDDPNKTLAVINIIPYGNTEEYKIQGKYEFECQNGIKECKGNLIMSCAVKKFSYLKANNFIICLEENHKLGFEVAAQNCLSNEYELIKDLQNCLNTESKQIQHEMAEKTNSLQPPIEYVPWVTVNGKHDEVVILANNLVDYICSLRPDRELFNLCSKPFL